MNLSANEAPASPPRRMERRGGHSWAAEWRSKFPAVAIAGIAVALLLVTARPVSGQPLLSTDFETDPVASGWTASGTGAGWTTAEAASGSHALFALNDVWATPLLDTIPLQWYRLTFKSKAPGTVNNPGSIGYGYWSAVFFDSDGTELSADQYSSVFASADWVTNEFRIRAKHTVGVGGALVAARMRVRFHPIGSQPLYIDDVVIQPTTMTEVAQWADALYDRMPAKLEYTPKSNRWARIPRTMHKLQTGQPLRIVMLGDSVQSDTANAPIDAFLQRAYPGSTVELISSIRGGTGVQYFRDHVQEYVTSYRPDLLMIGGISNFDDMAAYQNLVNQVRADDAAKFRTTEMIVQTRAWSPNNLFNAYFLSPGMTELDQDPARNPGIPDDFRGHLLNFAAANGIEYLDMTGIAAEFIYGPAAAAGLGPPTGADGEPYSYWLRDWVHSNDFGKQILGRELGLYFAPTSPVAADSAATKPGDGMADGLGDAWQARFGAWGIAPATDADGDGVSNFAESIAGTDPFSPGDALRVTGISAPGETIALTFPSVKGKNYQLLSSASLGSLAWSPVAGASKLRLDESGSETLLIGKPPDAARFYLLEVGDHDADLDGVSDWAEELRGTDAPTLGLALNEFQTDPLERPIFAETFSSRSRFGLDRMSVHDGCVSGAPGEFWSQVAYFFDEPLNVTKDEIIVYWAFRADPAAGPELGTLHMYLNFTEVPTTTYPEPGRVALRVRSRSVAVLYCDPGWLLPNDPEIQVYGLGNAFPDAQTVEKFRMRVRWAGGDQVLAEPAWWNQSASRWESLVDAGGNPAVMTLSIATHLKGHTTFPSLFFQPPADVPCLDTVLVTRRAYF